MEQRLAMHQLFPTAFESTALALIVAAGVLIASVLIEACYCITISLVRWTPLIGLGAIVGWLAYRHGAGAFDALGLALLGVLLMRHLRTRLRANSFDD